MCLTSTDLLAFGAKSSSLQTSRLRTTRQREEEQSAVNSTDQSLTLSSCKQISLSI